MLADLEQFTVTKDGERFDRRNFNFWGVTFARGDDRFYATLGSGSETYLVVGSLKARTLRVIYSHLECPSLSPDETRIAFKRSTNSHGSWRLWVLDLKTMRAHPLAEAASVDDQVEWRDDRSVLYWRGGDIWVVPSDGGGSPRKLVTAGSSPTVVRTG
jgi:Tol biopolymer transport system component